MTVLNVLNNKFEDSSKLEIMVDLTKVNKAVVHQVVKAYLAGKRSGNASTKTRAFVSGGGAKPYKQKGTGRARRGSSRSPLVRGGAVVFGPLPRSYEQKVNKQVRDQALLSVLADKYQSGKLLVIEKLEFTGKTGELYKFLNARGLDSSLLVVASESPVLRAARNLRYAKAVICGPNPYDVLRFENLIIEKEVFTALMGRLG
jgi:large subunit ribosomal protein L4